MHFIDPTNGFSIVYFLFINFNLNQPLEIVQNEPEISFTNTTSRIIKFNQKKSLNQDELIFKSIEKLAKPATNVILKMLPITLFHAN